MNQRALIIAIAAGVTCAILAYLGQSLNLAGFVFILFTALPIYCGALAGGTRAAIVSALVAFTAIAALISLNAALFAALAFIAPAAILGHQVNLAQQTEEGETEWYPLSMLLFNLAVIISIAIVAIGLMTANNNAEVLTQLTANLEQIIKNNYSDLNLNEADLKAFVEQVVNSLPFVLASLWLVVHGINLALAMSICRNASLLARPKEDFAANATLPMAAVGILVVALICMMIFSGAIQIIASVAAGAFLTAFSIVGLASAHFRLRGNPGGAIILALIYVTILFLTLPFYLFAIGGLMRTFYQPSQSIPPAAGN